MSDYLQRKRKKEKKRKRAYEISGKAVLHGYYGWIEGWMLLEWDKGHEYMLHALLSRKCSYLLTKERRYVCDAHMLLHLHCSSPTSNTTKDESINWSTEKKKKIDHKTIFKILLNCLRHFFKAKLPKYSLSPTSALFVFYARPCLMW